MSKRREKMASLKIVDSPGMDALHDAMFLPGKTVSFQVAVEGKLPRLSAAVMSVDLNDSPEKRRDFLVTGIILRNKKNGEWAGCHYLAYVNILTRRGTLVILGEPVENGPDWEKIGRQIKDGVDCPATESDDDARFEELQAQARAECLDEPESKGAVRQIVHFEDLDDKRSENM